MRSLLRDLPPLIWFSVWYGLSERVERARDGVSRPWLAAYQPVQGGEPATMDADELRRRIHAALFETPSCDDSMVSLVDAVLLAFGPAPAELEQARVELARWDRRWELSELVVKRLQAKLDTARAQNEWLSDKLTEMVDAAMAEGWERLADEWDVAAQRAALWELLKRAVRSYRDEWKVAQDHDGQQISRLEGALHLRNAEIVQLRKDVGNYHSALNDIAEIIECGGVSSGELPGKVRELIAEWAENIEQLRAEVDRLLERDAHGDLVRQRDHWRTVAENRSRFIQELVEQRENYWAELEQLREDLAHARNQLAGPLGGDMVTLHVGRDKTVTGTLLVYPNGDRYVAGWLVDVHGRTLVPAPDGGDS